jgi:hypothetical protein
MRVSHVDPFSSDRRSMVGTGNPFEFISADPTHDLAEHVPGSEAFMRLRGIGERVLRGDAPDANGQFRGGPAPA